MQKFEHDCKNCNYLATVVIDEEQFDLYHCLQTNGGGHPTIIARFSSKGEDYASGLKTAKLASEGELDGCYSTPAYIKALAIGYVMARLDNLNVGQW